MRFIRKNNSGFSLVELLVVMVMLSVISLAIYSTFNNGFKIWQKVNQPLEQQDLGIFFDKLAQDLSNCLHSANIPFSGSLNTLTIPTLVFSPRLKIKSLGSVDYFYDPQAGFVYRQTKDFSQLYNRQQESPVLLLKEIRFFRFEYYYFDAEKQTYLWQEEWLSTGLPLAVRVVLGFNDSDENNQFIRTISVPIGA